MELNGVWSLRQPGKARRYRATVPGCVHTDLLAAGAIPDPFYRDNEARVQWVSDKVWTYEREFIVPGELLARDRLYLRCEGLDTLATVYLNGRRLARADNKFRTWEFNVKKHLRSGRNRIEVRFDPATEAARSLDAKRHLLTYKFISHEVEGRSWLRKSPCDFGWDWGPALVTCGIWRPIRLVAFDAARLSDIKFRQNHGKKSVKVTVDISAETASASPINALVKLNYKGGQVACLKSKLRAGHARLCLNISSPQLWWPNGMGAQPLYEVTVRLLNANGELLDHAVRRIGLRSLGLERKKDKWGESFHFKVNGLPFFAKGGNWIPADAFQTRVTPQKYETLLNDCAAANMNMLRVWGGGIYESDTFYDLCDKLGLCVWQDFMFACAPYPAFDALFMKNVRAEAEDNVRRLRHHACLALWCGNNEIESCGFTSDNPRALAAGLMRRGDYNKLFNKLLPRVVRRLDPERDYWPSSPHTPGGGKNRHVNDHARGDAHLWGVWHGRKPFEWYRTCKHRFNSEFGFQSFPEPRTVHGYTNPAERNITHPVMEWHQRCGIGNSVIMDYMLSWFRMPGGFNNMLWVSQIQQGMAIKYAVEHWRRSMPRGMGTLYWQINDNWPVASWSSIDYHGRWKALHYMARHFFAPLLVSGLEDPATGKVEVHVTNDLLKSVSAKVTWLLTSAAGKRIACNKIVIQAPALKNCKAVTLDFGRYLKAYGPDDLLLWIEAEARGEPVSRNLVLFARPKQIELPRPVFSLAVRQGNGGNFLVTVRADRPALWTWLNLPGIDAGYSDNFFNLPPGRPVKVVARPRKAMSLREFRRELRVHSLVDTYRHDARSA
jgi:beta-mannosidase